MTDSRDPAADRRGTDHHGHDVIDPLQVAVLTVSSSRASETDADDPGGDRIEALLEDHGHRTVERELVPDDYADIRNAVRAYTLDPTIDVVVTTGGTGVTPDDVSIDAVAGLFEVELPGFGELFRHLSYEEVGTRVVATRAAAGIVGGTVVFCLPGSVNAVTLATEEIIVEEAPHLAGQATRHRTAGESP